MFLTKIGSTFIQTVILYENQGSADVENETPATCFRCRNAWTISTKFLKKIMGSLVT